MHRLRRKQDTVKGTGETDRGGNRVIGNLIGCEPACLTYDETKCACSRQIDMPKPMLKGLFSDMLVSNPPSY